MFHRDVNFPKNLSFFLFGARSTGKSTLIRQRFEHGTVHIINLLEPDTEERFALDPRLLEREVQALPSSVTHVVIDEVQKNPKLLDVVHNLIETHQVPQRFVLTGSSSRKLKFGGANLLAGRAVLRSLFPLTATELGQQDKVTEFVTWGGLPAVWNQTAASDRRDILQAYAHTYWISY